MHSIRDAQRLVIQKSRFFEKEHGERFVDRLVTLKERSIEEMIEAGSVLCGSPETVVAQMRRIRDVLGNGHFNINMKIGTVPDAVVRRGMELFRDRVLPEAREL
jgi:alkanesulfonate monooxygenase SsuD/methylene tetrahydromethanopterin reductase-like flavin-dependent oxidoreductase (luciferase family)